MDSKDEDELIIRLPHPDYIIRDDLEYLIEVTVKAGNGVWRIHNNNPDDIFPSDPHADRVDQHHKLNLFTGDYFDNNKVLVGTLSKKELAFIHAKIKKSKLLNVKAKLGLSEDDM
jgi:hypothetical protein